MGATIGTVPRRASAGSRRLRGWFDWRRRWFPLRDAGSSLLGKIGAELRRDLVTGGLTPGLAVWALLPGGAHWHVGYRLRAAFFAIPFWLLGIAGLVLIGTLWGEMLLGLALAVHVASIVDLLTTPDRSSPAHTTALSATAAAILIAWYGPLIYLTSTVIFVRQLAAPVGTYETGDVVLFRTSFSEGANPRPGDVVLYDLDRRTDKEWRDSRMRAGERFDRVLAGPGSILRWNQGEPLVDGRPSPWMPIATTNPPADLTLEVPPKCYCILPGILPDGLENSGMVWHMVSIVPREVILGRPWLRTHPFSRAAWLERPPAQ